jgi:hypothetical protein
LKVWKKSKKNKKGRGRRGVTFSLFKKMKKRGYAFSNRLSKNIIRPPLT